MKTLADIIIHLRDKVAPLVDDETRELVNDAIYAIKAILTRQHLDKRLASLQTPLPTEGGIEQLAAEVDRLQAELAERERQIEALGKARLSGLAE